MQEITIQAVRSRARPSDLIRYATLIRVISVRDLKARYKQSLLGPLWLGIQPLTLLGAYIVGFRGVSRIGTGHVPYAVFALAGITLWAYFQAVAVAGTAVFPSNGALVMQTACPRIVFPISPLFSCLPSFLIPLSATVVASAAVGTISLRWLLLPIPAVWMFCVTAGIIAITSSVTVRFRDMLQVMPFLLQLGAFVVPVGYPVSTLSPTLRLVVSLNPLTGIIEAWRWAMLDTARPYMPCLYLSLGIGAVVIFLGWRVFSRTEVKMADIL
jgi:ABC-type polysaccharide/polyol phosphate export permease